MFSFNLLACCHADLQDLTVMVIRIRFPAVISMFGQYKVRDNVKMLMSDKKLNSLSFLFDPPPPFKTKVTKS